MPLIEIEDIPAKVLELPFPEPVVLVKRPIQEKWSQFLAFLRAWIPRIIIWVLAPLLFVIKVVTTAYYRAYIRFFKDQKADLRMKCPACGFREHQKIRWDPVTQLIIHACPRCAADFGHPPIKDATLWSYQSHPDDKGRRLFEVS